MSIKSKIKSIIKNIFNSKKYPVPKMVYSNKLLEGKVALITGGSSGIGYEIAKEFIENGCKVIICGRNKSRIEESVKKLGKNSKGLELDINDVSNIETKIKEAVKLSDNKEINILVNSAGIGASLSFFDVTEANFDEIMNTNLRGTFFMTQKMGDYMKSNNIKGHILNLSSSSALRPAWTPYEISKWGIKGFTIGAADILSKYGITVNAIAPGPTATPMLNKNEKDNIAINTNCVKRMSLPSEIATLAVYLCSDIGEMIVGETVYITGGAGNIINRFD